MQKIQGFDAELNYRIMKIFEPYTQDLKTQSDAKNMEEAFINLIKESEK